jgi:hypothetical protein
MPPESLHGDIAFCIAQELAPRLNSEGCERLGNIERNRNIFLSHTFGGFQLHFSGLSLKVQMNYYSKQGCARDVYGILCVITCPNRGIAIMGNNRHAYVNLCSSTLRLATT